MTYYDEDENENSDRKKFLAFQKVNQGKEEPIDKILKIIFLPIQMIPTFLEIIFKWKHFNKQEKLRLSRLFLCYTFFLFLVFCCFGGTKLITVILATIYGISFALKKFDEQEILWIKKMLSIALYDSLGNVPKKIQESENEIILKSPGIPLESYLKKREHLESVLNRKIKKMTTVNSYNHIKLELASGLLPEYIEFDEKCLQICQKNKEIWILGFDGDSPVFFYFLEIPHLLCCGSSGQGKSVMLRTSIVSILLSSHDVRVFGIDFKGTLEFQYWEDWSSSKIAGTIEIASEIIDFVYQVMENRFKEYRACNCKDIKSYRSKVNINEAHLFVMVDEWADLYLKMTAYDKKNKSYIGYIDKIESITRLGRAVGVHCVFSTQYAESSNMPSQIKNNLTFRNILKVQSDAASINLVGNSDAYNLPDIKGRMIFSTGGVSNQEIQGIYLSEDRAVEILNSIPKRPVEPDFIKYLEKKSKDILVKEMLEENTRRGF